MRREITDETQALPQPGQLITQASSTDRPEDSAFSELKGICEPLLLTVPQVAQCLHLSRAMVYELIEQKEIPVIHFGRAIRIPLDSLRQRIKELEEQEKQESGHLETNISYSSKKQQRTAFHKEK